MKKLLKRLSAKWLWILGVLILLLAAGGAVLISWHDLFSEVESTVEPVSLYQTAPVSVGDITLSATGTGSLVAGSEADLGFLTAGRLAELRVKLGDVVSAGDVLAVLDGVDQLTVNVKTKEIALSQAQKALAEYRSSGSENLAQAAIDLADAQAAYQVALDNVRQSGDERCDDSLTSKYWFQFHEIEKQLAVWEAELNGNSKYGRDFILEHIYPLRKARNEAYNNWAYCDAYTEQDVAESQAALQLAQANLDLANSTYQQLLKAAGIDPQQVQILTARVNDAQAQWMVAENALENAVLKAPVGGTVISISAAVGEEVGTSTLISLADLDHPRVAVQIDEADLQNIAVGCAAQLTFDSIADRTFSGSVTQIEPTLVSTNGYDAVQGIIQMDAVTQTLPIGLNASVDVVCGEAINALLAPVEALHAQADGTVMVYVLHEDGSMEQRAVEIGLQDATNVEVLSGLHAGEKVIIQGPGIPIG